MANCQYFIAIAIGMSLHVYACRARKQSAYCTQLSGYIGYEVPEWERERKQGKRWKRPWPWALKFCCIPVHWLQGQTFNVNYMHHVIYWHFRFFTQKPFLYIWLSNYYYRTYELYKIACAFVSLSFLFLTCLFLQHSNGNSNGKFKTTNFLGHGLQNWNACICDCADNGFRCMQRQTTTTGRYWRT